MRFSPLVRMNPAKPCSSNPPAFHCKLPTVLAAAPRGMLIPVRQRIYGQTIASGGDTQLVKLWNVSTGKVTNTLKGHEDSIDWVGYSPDGKRIANGISSHDIAIQSTDGTWAIALWDIKP